MHEKKVKVLYKWYASVLELFGTIITNNPTLNNQWNLLQINQNAISYINKV